MTADRADGQPGGAAPGARQADGWQRAEPSLVSAFAALTTSVVGDAMNRWGTMAGDIRPLWRGARLVGSALPVWVRPGDNLLLHRALQAARPGDVLVVNGHGSLQHAVFGELMGRQAVAVGLAGLVVDGAVRDRRALEELRFPVFARGCCPGGPAKGELGEVGYPVACGGVVCTAGDVVIGDDDGIVVVPRADAGVVLAAAREIHRWEAARRRAVAAGHPVLED